MRLQNQIRLGLDIGGSKIAAIALDSCTGELKFKTKISTPKTYEALLNALKTLLDNVESELQTEVTYGMCYPGSRPPGENCVQNSNIQYLNGKAFERDLSTLFSREIKAGNDANCFALSEALEGAGKGKSVVFGATLGTGLGGGVVINGAILEGLNKLGGEWGHNALPNMSLEERNVEACYCARVGCLESFLSGTGLSQTYALRYGEKLSAERIIEKADQQDPQALAELDRYEDRLARACGMVINLIDPDVIVLGGGLSSLVRLYDNVPRLWQNYVFSSKKIQTPLLPAMFGPESGVRGAAWLWGRSR